MEIHFSSTVAALRSETPHYHCGSGHAGSQGGSEMAGGSSKAGDAIEKILPQGDTAGRGCKWHLQFDNRDLHNFRSTEASPVESIQHIFL